MTRHTSCATMHPERISVRAVRSFESQLSWLHAVLGESAAKLTHISTTAKRDAIRDMSWKRIVDAGCLHSDCTALFSSEEQRRGHKTPWRVSYRLLKYSVRSEAALPAHHLAGQKLCLRRTPSAPGGIGCARRLLQSTGRHTTDTRWSHTRVGRYCQGRIRHVVLPQDGTERSLIAKRLCIPVALAKYDDAATHVAQRSSAVARDGPPMRKSQLNTAMRLMRLYAHSCAH